MITKNITSLALLIGCYALIELLSLVKISLLFGAQTAYFSGFSLIGPLAALWTGFGFGAAFFLLRRLVRGIMLGTPLFSIFSLYLPTFAAAWYFQTNSWILRVGVPIMCMVLFMVHPVGGQAWYYACYWLIPVVLYMMRTTHYFTEALGATFVAHGVGSVIWLYCIPTTPMLWTGLLPVVMLERLVCALGMVSIQYACMYAQAKYKAAITSKQHVSQI